MKKILLSFTLLGIMATANSQIINGNFEAVATPLLPGIATDCPGWGQGLYSMETSAPFAGTQSAYLRTIVDAQVAPLLGWLSDTIAGLLQQSVNGPFTNAGGDPLNFAVKHMVAAGDTAAIIAQYLDTMMAGPNDDVVMFQASAAYTGTAAWATGSAVFQPFGTGTANLLVIIASSSVPYLFGNGFGIPGSQLWLDNISIGTASINELNASANVYPNPSTDVVNFEVSEEINTVVLFGMDGKFAASTTENTMNISNLPNGIYFYTITTVTGQTLTGKVTKI